MTSSNDASGADRALAQAVRIARQSPDRLLAIVGPTASGKTSLAVGLAEAIGGEVVSADSVQVYRAFDVGSGKPTPAETARARHHLVGTLDPLEPMDAAAWATLADAAVTDIRARGRVPIVCGGTFLWVKALLFGLAGAPPADAATRASHRAIAERDGRPALHARLRAIDPASADRLHPNDLVRVSRALEVHELTGKTMSALQGEHGFLRARHDAVLLGLASEPATLTARITDRARAWLAEGWVDEVRALLDAGYADARAMASVGYAQVRDALEGRLPLDDLEGAIVRATRVFARRQRTWLNHVDVAWLPR